MCKKESDASKKMVTLFISYTSCDRPIVDLIQNKICEKLQNKIKISRFDDLKYKESFRSFMNTICEHDFVLSVVSDTYLKRKACMYEISEVLKNHHYKEKLIFVVLSESERTFYQDHIPKKIGVDIYDRDKSKLKYTLFWQEQYNELEEQLQQVNSEEAKKEIINELQIIGQIYRKDIGEFLKFLSDENGKNFKKLYENEFEDLIQLIDKSSQLFKNKFEHLIDSKLEELYLRFPHNTDIADSFANSLFKLSLNEDVHIISLAVDYLERIYNEHPCINFAHIPQFGIRSRRFNGQSHHILNLAKLLEKALVQYCLIFLKGNTSLHLTLYNPFYGYGSYDRSLSSSFSASSCVPRLQSNTPFPVSIIHSFFPSVTSSRSSTLSSAMFVPLISSRFCMLAKG